MKNFCKVPFSQLEVTPNGDARFCCKISDIARKKDLSPYNLLTDSFDDIWNSDDFNSLRRRFLNGERPEVCNKCWTDEVSGIQSLRLQSSMLEVDVHKPKIICLSLKLSNKCNCACRICSYWLSSLWVNELKKQDRYPAQDHGYLELSMETKLDKNNNFEMIKDIATNLDRLFIYGGEPLMDKEVLDILRYCKESKKSKNINLIINTNGTIMNDEILDLLNSFKHTSLYFSIDDTEDRYNYERWPANWDKVGKTLQSINDLPVKSTMTKCLYASISVFNILYLDELLDEFRKFENMPVNLDNIIYDPSILCIYNLPEEIKPVVKRYVESIDWENNKFEFDFDYANNIKSFIDLKVSPYSRETYKLKLDEFLSRDDIRRKQDWKTTFQKLYLLLD